MAKKRSLVIALVLFSVIAVAAIVCVIWVAPDRSGEGSGVGINAGGISVMAGGISWLGLSVIGGVALSILFVRAALVSLFVSRRNSSE